RCSRSPPRTPAPGAKLSFRAAKSMPVSNRACSLFRSILHGTCCSRTRSWSQSLATTLYFRNGLVQTKTATKAGAASGRSTICATSRDRPKLWRMKFLGRRLLHGGISMRLMTAMGRCSRASAYRLHDIPHRLTEQLAGPEVDIVPAQGDKLAGAQPVAVG